MITADSSESYCEKIKTRIIPPHTCRILLRKLQTMKNIKMVKKYRDGKGKARVVSQLTISVSDGDSMFLKIPKLPFRFLPHHSGRCPKFDRLSSLPMGIRKSCHLVDFYLGVVISKKDHCQLFIYPRIQGCETSSLRIRFKLRTLRGDWPGWEALPGHVWRSTASPPRPWLWAEIRWCWFLQL